MRLGRRRGRSPPVPGHPDLPDPIAGRGDNGRRRGGRGHGPVDESGLYAVPHAPTWDEVFANRSVPAYAIGTPAASVTGGDFSVPHRNHRVSARYAGFDTHLRTGESDESFRTNLHPLIGTLRHNPSVFRREFVAEFRVYPSNGRVTGRESVIAAVNQ